MRNYRKTSDQKAILKNLSIHVHNFILSRLKVAVFVCAIFVLIVFVKFIPELSSINAVNDDDITISFTSHPLTATTAKKNIISIPDGTIKANPFLPYREINKNSVNDVPQFDIVEPPEVINENSDAARVMDTIVSGILYDKFSPSAILNIEGNDYLVKKGDTINNYKILNILQDRVTVKLGSNTYSAGIGEILTEGELNRNVVSNLNKKFGGER